MELMLMLTSLQLKWRRNTEVAMAGMSAAADEGAGQVGVGEENVHIPAPERH
jgi:hypothetical protein